MLLIALSLVGCSDYDNGFTEKQIAYEKQFTDIFGQIDPNQDWSMAAYVSAKVTVANAGQGSTVEIYTDVPAYATTKLLTRATIKDSDISFNVVKGTEQVYAVVRNNGKVLVQGFYDIQNEAINITDKPVAKRAAKMLETRFGDGSSVKIGKTDAVDIEGKPYELEATLLEKKYKWDSNYYTLEELRELITNEYQANPGSFNQWNHRPFNDDCVIHDWDFTDATINENVIEQIGDNQYQYRDPEKQGITYTWDELIQEQKKKGQWDDNKPLNCTFISTYFDFTNATVNTTEAPFEGLPKNIAFTHLEGVEKEAAKPWHLALGYELFGPNTFFMEGEYYFGKNIEFDKTTLYGETDDEKIKMMQAIERGFSIVTEGGEIEIPFIYGATAKSNQFGYIYYKEGQDPLDQPHYILMEDATPSGNIYFTEWGNPDNAVGGEGMQLSGWTNDDDYPLEGYSESTYVYGTTYRLSFFGENHNEVGTYNFPAGYHIVFFIKGDIPYNFSYSLPELNERINHLYGNDNKVSLTYQNGLAPAGSVKATAWRANGMTFMGFEDGGNDEDLNDIVFWVEGEYSTDTDIPDFDVDDEMDPMTWIFACEDLGGSFDYDFNDVVWEAVQTFDGDDQSGWTINLLAAGGTLPVELWYDDQQLCEDVHQAFGQQPDDDGLYTPINVGARATEAPQYLYTIETRVNNINNIKNNFKVKVNKGDGQYLYVTAPQKDGTTTPQIIILPGEWLWPRESVLISDAYNEFIHWTQDREWTQWTHHAPNYRQYTTQRYQQ